ncbi:MAG: phospholipase [Dactylosporangium sp.]|nr:phospholipase [Dactylosporangium sp.]NNJ60990.1 phospholipase [Dactylosporangium sp.]
MRSTRLAVAAVAAVASVAAIVAGIVVASPASATTRAQKLTTLSAWSQPTTISYTTWNAARRHQADWASYRFDWSTDYCSASPDRPLGFDFRMSCWRHDFGYRNSKAMRVFPSGKDRIDTAFYFDLKAKCAAYPTVVQPACALLAWTYYEAVSRFGGLSAVDQADLDAAATVKARALASG